MANEPEILEGEMQADAEHQQDHTKLGELMNGFDVAMPERGVRTDRQARQHVADDCGNAQPSGDQTCNQGEPQGDRHVCQDGEVHAFRDYAATQVSLRPSDSPYSVG